MNNITSTTVYPCSHRQEAMWIDEDIHLGIPVNNVLTRFIIRGNIDTEAFINAFRFLCSQTPILGSVVELDKSKGQRAFKFPGKLKTLDVIELDHDSVSDYERTRDFQNWIEHKFTYGENLYRAQLVKFTNELFGFYLNQHHSITDGSSCAQLHRNLSVYYQMQFEEQDESNSRALGNNNYGDFLTDKQASRQVLAFEKKDRFWISHYSQPVEPVTFYSQSTYNKTAKTTRITYQLDEKMSASIKKSSISTSIIFTSVLFAFLNRVTLNKKLSIGVPLLNRKSDYSDAIGLLMEVCPNRISISKEDTFDSIIKKVRMDIEAIRDYRDHFVPAKKAGYEVILNILTPSPSTFAGLPADYELTTPLNLLENIESDIPGTGWPGRESLAIQVQQSPDGNHYELNFDYNSGVWTSSVLRERAVAHFGILLKELLNDRSQKIAEINLLTSDEASLLFPKEDSAYFRGDIVPSVIELFNQQVLKSPNKIAVQFNEEDVSYSSLSLMVEGLAQQLCGLRVKPGILVGVCIERSPKMVMCLLAIMRAGGAYVPIDPKQPSDRIAIILEDADPLVIITETILVQKITVRSGKKIILLDDNPVDLAEKPSKFPTVRGEGLAYVIFTSGSTGRPKGVEVRHHGLTTFLQAMSKQPGMNSHDILLSVTTISFDIAALELFLPLVTGATVRIVPYESTINGNTLIALLSSNTTVLQATPATYRLLISCGWEGDPKLKIMCGGEALPYELAQKLLSKCQSLWNMYGPTETTIWSSVHQVEKEENQVSIGKPIMGTQMFVLNENMRPVPIGVAGELYIAGDGITNGYYRNEELTKKQFLPNIFSGMSNAKMYKTGDMVRYNLSMELEYIGRIDFQVKVRGFRIEIGEIETVLGSHESVAQNVVVTLPDENGDQSLVAYLVKDNPSIDGKELHEYLKSKLPDYMIPSKFVLLKSLPLTPNGKVNRKELPDPETSLLSVGVDYQAPRNDFERSLVSVWQEILKLSKVGITDNFFDLGGDSLLTVPLVHEMERATGVKFDIGDIFNSPTIEQLIEERSNDIEKGASSIVPLQSKGSNIPLFCLCGINIYQDLADSLGDLQPVYGIYVADEQVFLEGLIDGDGADISIEQLVSSYYDAICRQQPTGPYQLAGVSFGGFLAIETARLLQENNKEVHSVILLDTILPTEVQRSLLAHVRTTVKKIMKKGYRVFIETFGFTSSKNMSKLSNIREEAFLKAMETYESSGEPYNGHVILMKAKNHKAWGKGVSFLSDYGWSRFVQGNIDCYEVEGDHLGILKSPNVSQIAQHLAQHLKL